VYFALAMEYYAFNEGMSENLVPGVPRPDVLNTSWRDYGNRVGAWRILAAFAEYGLPLSILLNTALYDHAPALLGACRKSGCEIIAHGHSNSDLMAGMDESTERGYIHAVTERIRKEEGAPPQGWASPWIAETLATPDLLQEAGYGYLLDWCMDDQPVWMSTRSGHILSVPCSQELNDSTLLIGRRAAASEFCDRIVDQFDELQATAGEEPLVMSVLLHSFISGQPFRLHSLRRALDHLMRSAAAVWFTHPGLIASHILSMSPSPRGTP
jgi:peptidoglycan/xylan/chitin deacetylase (PgdA/CDA1 family)